MKTKKDYGQVGREMEKAKHSPNEICRHEDYATGIKQGREKAIKEILELIDLVNETPNTWIDGYDIFKLKTKILEMQK